MMLNCSGKWLTYSLGWQYCLGDKLGIVTLLWSSSSIPILVNSQAHVYGGYEGTKVVRLFGYLVWSSLGI